MPTNGSHSGDYALGAVIAGVVAWDVLGRETISNSVRRHSEKPWEKFMLAGFMGALTIHLLGMYPQGRDPFTKLLEGVRRETPSTS